MTLEEKLFIKQKILELFLSGKRLKDIFLLIDGKVSRSQIGRILEKELGKEEYTRLSELLPKTRKSRLVVLTKEETLKKILMLFNENLYVSEIAQKVHLKTKDVWDFLEKELGVSKDISDEYRKTLSKKALSVQSDCKYCNKLFPSIYAVNGHQHQCSLNPNKIIRKGISRLHTQETKDKISEIRKEYIRNNPDKVPYRLYHKSKGRSYPEKYFFEVFTQRGLKFEEQFPLKSYDLDFAFVNKRIDIEIDGNQHFIRGARVKSDYNRDSRLLELGWKTFRIVWADYQKLDIDLRNIYLDELISKFDLLSNSSLTSVV